MKKIVFFLSALLLLLLPANALATTAEETSLIGDVCPVCHFCSAPFGICVLIWLAALLVILILLVAILGRKKRCPACGEKNKRRAAICAYCGQDLRNAAAQSISQAPTAAPFMTQTANAHTDTAPIRPAMVKPQEQSHPPAETKNATRICPSCGKELPARAIFCSACGRRL